MKKMLLLLTVIALIGSIYIIIPAKLTISKALIADCNINAFNRCFSDTSKWIKWWPQNKGDSTKDVTSGASFTYNGCIYKITSVLYGIVQVSIQYDGDSTVNSNIIIASHSQDSVLIHWECSLATGNTPYKKILQYQHARHIKNNMDAILNSLELFVADIKNIYGINFHQAMSKDSSLVTMSITENTYPTTAEIYQLIDSVKEYIASQRAKEINYPMLNVSKINDKQFRTMVAISANKELEGNKRIVIKRFVPWKMIEGEVRGGTYSVDKAFEQFYNYKEDYRKSVMAIPFQSLITDRSKEQDTTKWVTKICAPIS